MHHSWLLLRLAWSVVVIVYFVLAIVGSRRLRGKEKKLNHVILVVMAVLVGIRIVVHWAFGGTAYRFTVLFVGVAAGIYALIVAKMLISPTPSDEAVGVDRNKDRIQSLKLS